MRNVKKYLFVLLLLIPVLLNSCASIPEEKIDSVYVMIYDYNNTEVMNVSVFVDGELAGVTDIYGRLTFFCKEEKESVIRIEKKGYETVETKCAIKAGSVLYFKCGSGTYYAENAEKLLDAGDTGAALKMIENAIKVEERKDWLYLKNVILRNEKNEIK